MAAFSLEDRPTPSLLEAVSDDLSQPGVRVLFVRACIDHYGWSQSYRRANARISQWLDPHDAHQLPADALLLLRRCITGRCRFMEILYAEDARVSREQIVNAERYGPMRSVRPEQRRKERA